ncbi:hypothetical protein [Luteococcus peritonei]|uniref:DMT family transporter n=1 Tax=Luteococcus peritonei TaxID=88874 RepID=A0ABW4RV05_9ACTN
MAAAVLSGVFLVLGVLAYGFAGANLHAGSRDERGALRSRTWWSGTVLQAAGFLFTLAARRTLPLMVVQVCANVGLGITAAIQHATGARRLGWRDALALVALLLGLAILGPTTVPGPAVAIRPAHELLMAGCALICLVGLALPLPPALLGVLAGVGFSFGAIGARLVIGDAAHPLWRFWELPASTWLVGLLTGVGIVLGQVQMTRGLARSSATTVLGPMYLVETLLPSLVGVTLMGELPRAGMMPLTVIGILVALAGALWLLRLEPEAAQPHQPRSPHEQLGVV